MTTLPNLVGYDLSVNTRRAYIPGWLLIDGQGTAFIPAYHLFLWLMNRLLDTLVLLHALATILVWGMLELCANLLELSIDSPMRALQWIWLISSSLLLSVVMLSGLTEVWQLAHFSMVACMGVSIMLSEWRRLSEV